MLNTLQAITFGGATLLLSYIGVALFTVWAERARVLDIPNARSLHRRPMPRGAGLVIVGLTLLGAWVHQALFVPARPWLPLLVYTAAGLLIAGVSWRDDISGVPVGLRLTVHGIAAAITLWGLGYWRIVALPVFGELSLGWIGVPLTFFWIVGLINAINFMDGIDGITGGQAVVATSAWTVVGWLMREPTVSTLSILLASSSLGFLVHNWPPGRVFMGDVGSAFLGYSLSVLPLFITPIPTWSAVTAALVVWPFVFDTGFTFLRRLCRAENVFAAHRSHLYQRLVAAGYAQRSVTLLYIGLAVTSGVLALAWSRDAALRDQTVILGCLLICVTLRSIVWQQERWWAARRP